MQHLQDTHPPLSSHKLLSLSVVSALVYFLLTILILRFVQGTTLLSLFQHGFSTASQLGIGIIGGTAGALLIGMVVFNTAISEILNDYRIISLLNRIRLSPFDRVQISLFAGAGEELLFRGALQPVLGIWITSALFVAVHGYFKFSSVRHLIFGALMFCLSAGLGLLFEWAGLIAAMTAHAVYDIVMLHIGYTCRFGNGSRDVS